MTDDDVAEINGKRVELVGKVQSRYSYAREKAEAKSRNLQFMQMSCRGGN